jgi:2-hydroxychromene-2-carboxylate isomerase
VSAESLSDMSSAAAALAPPKVVFNYDIVCPYAYIASRRIEAVVKEANPNATIEWTPVLLGVLYKVSRHTARMGLRRWQDKSSCRQSLIDIAISFLLVQLDVAPQGKDGSASAVMPLAKQKLMGRDLLRNAARFGVPLNFHPNHPLRSLNAMRLLSATPPEKRAQLSHALYEAYWVKNEDITDATFLERYARAHGIDPAIGATDQAKATLERQTQQCSDRGAFGVPSFFVYPAGWSSDTKDSELSFFFGQDRLPFVAHALGGNRNKELARITIPRSVPLQRMKVKFFFDFASPWAFLAHTQIKQIAAIADVEYVPVLLGAILKR